jgi:multiple sugar transport system ATP-binding protein
MADVKLSSITKKYGGITALKSIDLEIKDKEFFVLLGPTGAGKTTILRIVAGLEKQTEGDVSISNEIVNALIPAQRDVTFVFQYYTLYPNMSVRENLEFPLRSKLRNYDEDVIKEKVDTAAKVLKIEHLLNRRSTNLSGGEMQRVGIGRAIVRSPKVFLMDEPLSNLDAKLRETMRAELAHLHHDLGSTFFYVTHDHVEAMTMGDRIGVLNEGVIHQIGTPDEIYSTPANTFVAKFVGSPVINLFEAEVEGDTLNIGGGQMSCALSEKQAARIKNFGKSKVIFGIRPEDIAVEREQESKCAQPYSIYFKQSMGAEDILNLKAGDLLLRAVVAPNLEVKVHENVFGTFDLERAHFFDPVTEKRID